ncbi:MAG: zinc-ribbon domain-containing protein [Candidatus Lokiarchaeota archaeon]|nr:zinc-ribbon domain-containing protein [Candidatus Lokiarchaeota archaeon]
MINDSNKLICPKCDGSQAMSIIKAIPKDTRLILVNRCPNCMTKNKVVLNYANKDSWIDDVGNSFFTCDLCGAVNKDNIVGYTHYGSRAYWYYHGGLSERRKIVFDCVECGKKRVKVTTGDVWKLIEPYAREQKKEETEVPAPTEELKCPKCEKTISKNDTICPNCGLELICNNCGAPLVPGSNFCSNCGDKVETFPVEPSEPTNTCPSCDEPVDESTVFCPRCGQEVRCDKCGAELLEGASFCKECGDPVTQGEFD